MPKPPAPGSRPLGSHRSGRSIRHTGGEWQAFLAAKEIYHADPKIATAGAYFLQVADRLGIGEEVRKKGRTAGGGKVSMELMAKSTSNAIGLTQISEILSASRPDTSRRR